ncbi:tape measure protein [Vibrio metschnikovii]|nr:tape measure protein [Vibrio metschnikovii]
MAIDAGTVYYTVDARTQKALDESEKLGVSLNKTSKEMHELDGKTKQLNSSFSKLATVIKTVIAAAALRQAADLVQSYQEMSERVQMATSSTAEFEEVQKRLLKTSNGTYRRLSEAQELYILTADSLRSMGYSTQQAIDVQDSMSYAFVKNATSVDRADAAINAFTKSVNTGRVAADQWQTLVAAIPTVIDDIATATGKTSAEIRALGSTGRITASQLTEGLRKSLSENAKAAEGMANNLTDAGVRVENALTAILVKFEQSTGAIKSFTEGVIKAADYVLEFSEDAEGMASVIKSVEIIAVSTAAVITGKLLGAMALYTQKQVEGIAATVKKNAADKLAAQAALRRAAVEKQAAMAVLATAKADATAAKVGTYAHTVAINNLTAARTAAIAATNAHAVAQANMNRVATVGTIAINGLRSAMAFLGGPVGVAFLAATAIYAFAKSQRDSKGDTDEMTASINGQIVKLSELRGEYDKLTKAGQEKFWAESNAALTENLSTQGKLNKEIAEAKKKLSEPTNSLIGIEDDLKGLADLQSQLNKAKSQYEKIQKARQALLKPLDEDKWVNPDDPDDDSVNLGGTGEITEGQKAINKLTESLRLAKLEGRELAQALALSGLDSKEIEKYGDEIKRLSGELFDLDQAIDNQDAIKDLEKELKLAALTGAELAETQALLSLNDYATPEQIERVKELSRLLYETKERSKFGDDPAKFIKGNVSPLSGGEIDNQDARYAAMAEKEKERYADQIKRLQEAKQLKIEIEGGYNEIEAQMEAEHQQRLTQIQEAASKARLKDQQATAQAQMQLYGQVFSSMSNMTSNMLSVMDEQSGAYKAMFAVQKAFAVAQAIVSAELAAAQVLAHDAGIMGMGAVATSNAIRTMGYASAGVIAGTAIAGGRLYGGSVKENGMYRINENGAPEVFNAANGQQYMLPNTRGEVVSNKDASGGGGITTINVTVNTDGSVETNGGANMQQLGKEIGQFVESRFRQLEARSMRQGGALWQYKQKK